MVEDLLLEDEIEEYEPPQRDDDIEAYMPPKAKVRAIKPKKPTKKKLTPKEIKTIQTLSRAGQAITRIDEKMGGPAIRKIDQLALKEERDRKMPSIQAGAKSEEKLYEELGPIKYNLLRALNMGPLAGSDKIGARLAGVVPDENTKIAQAQALYDKYGPTIFAVREGLGRAGASVLAPVKSAQIHIGDLLQGKITTRIEREAEMAKFHEPLGKSIERRGYDPFRSQQVLPFAIETLAPLAIKTPRGGIRPFEEGPLPEIGGGPPKVPPQLGPGRVIEGSPPSPSPRPSPSQAPLQLRSGRTIVGFPPARPPTRPSYLPPSPDRLARLDPGPMGPLGDMGIFAETAPRGWERAGARPSDSEDISFELVPSTRQGEAPVLVVPDWVLYIQEGRSIGGMNLDFQQIPTFHMKIWSQAPSPSHAEAAINSLIDIHKASAEQGLQTISLIGKTQAEGEISRPQYTGHETFHAGQSQVGTEKLQYPTVGIHGVGWAVENPIIQEVIAKYPERRMTPDQWAQELPAYIAGRQEHFFFDDVSKAIDFQYSYYQHIAELHGPDALDIISRTAKLSPESQETLQSARSTYDQRRRERLATAQPEGQIERRGQQYSDVRSLPGYAEGGVERRGDQEGVSPVAGETESVITPRSATGNIETLDPSRPEIALAEAEPPQGPKPGEASEGKIVPTLPGPMKIKGSALDVDNISPGDEPGKVRVQFADGTTAQFDLNDVRDRRGRKIRDPILYMIVEDPPVIGGPQGPSDIPPVPPLPPPGREGSLYVPVVSNVATRTLTERFSELLLSNNIEYDFTRKVSDQVYLAVLSGNLRDDYVDQILNEENIEWYDFASDALASVSEAARTMAHYSHVVRRHWLRLLRENPGLIQKTIPPAKQVELMVDEMERSILGMNWWKRLGRDTQKALLTQYSTAAVNFMGATLRVPADATSSIIGSMLQQMMEGKGTFQNRLVKAREAAEATIQAHVEVVRIMNPLQIEELSRGELGSEYSRVQEIITQLEKYFPDVHSKLLARTYGEEAEAVKKIEDYIPAAKLLLPRIKNESQRRELDQQIEKFEKRLKIEKHPLMQLVKGPEWLLDQILRPANFGEFLLRQPRFIGRLGLELSDRGIDLNRLIEIESQGLVGISEAMEAGEKTFRDIPEEAFKAALSDALEFTMAYDPRTDKDAPYVERYIGVPFIKIMNSLGILSLKFTAFPRAMVSAAKTTMEYTPLPILVGWRENSPFRRVFWKGKTKDPKTGEEYNPNPPSRGDYDRVGKALVGTFLLALAWKLIDEGILDNDGKKIKTPLKHPDGRPVYQDTERYKPISTHFRIAALLDRWHKGTMGDKNAANEIYEIITGMRRYEGDQDLVDLLDSTAELWGGDSDAFHKWNRTKEEVGRMFPAPFLTPLLNFRAVIAEVDKDENIKKDLKGYGFWGPSLDKIPILRRSLPNMAYPLEPGPVKLSLDPAMAGLAGVQLVPGQNAVGEEFRRMGINVRNYLRTDPDPIINREQNRAFEILTRVLGEVEISKPEYVAAPNNVKAAMLEDLLLGTEDGTGIVSAAEKAGWAANPVEADRRKLKGETPGRYRRKVTGVEKVLDVLQGITRK